MQYRTSLYEVGNKVSSKTKMPYLCGTSILIHNFVTELFLGKFKKIPIRASVSKTKTGIFVLKFVMIFTLCQSLLHLRQLFIGTHITMN
jgi:hypothetical protein